MAFRKMAFRKMAFRKMKITRPVTFIALLALTCIPAFAQQAKRPFTVADDIGFSHFVSNADAYCWFGREGIQFSPNGEFFSVLTARGRLELNQVEESVRFYRISDVEAFVRENGSAEAPEPLWTVTRISKEESIVDVRWLASSSGVALIENTEGTLTGRINKIEVLDLSKKTAETIASEAAHFERFEIHDRDRYVYVTEDEAERRAADQKWEAENRSPAIVLTGTNLGEIILRDDPRFVRSFTPVKQHLWEVSQGKRSEVKYNGSPISTSDFDLSPLLFSPDGHLLLIKQHVKDVPESWEKLYPPPYASSDSRRHAHASASEYVVLDLESGIARHLTDAPTGDDAGWWAGGGEPTWSSDGQSILLPGTFIKSKDDNPSRPCMAVFDVLKNTASCIEVLKGHINEREFEKGYRHFMSAQFVGGDKNQVEMTFFTPSEVTRTIQYRREANEHWKSIGEGDGYHHTGPRGLDLNTKQEWDQPPLLMASDGKTSRVLWDPNPHFKNIELGQTKVYEWKDKKGRSWRGGLYLPLDYDPGKRYPLVIQTHGFTKSEFLPSGSYPTAFAARELAAAGIAVLQVGGGSICEDLGPDEAPCEVSGFDSGARQLAADGIVDLEKVGYIGFSRSCWYGMEMLTNASFPLKASLLADGIAEPYWLFLVYGADLSAEMGQPFGEGLRKLVKTSPEFNLEKVRTPLLLTSEAKSAALELYQPYASLRYLKKPVELVMINTHEHVITNPVERMASQGLSVDWFRFWLQGYEEPDAAKAEQYKRWRGLRELQKQNDKKRTAPVN